MNIAPGAVIRFETSVGWVYGIVNTAYQFVMTNGTSCQEALHDRFWVEFDDRNSKILSQLFDWDSAVILLAQPEWIQIGLRDGAYGGPEYKISIVIEKGQ